MTRSLVAWAVLLSAGLTGCGGTEATPKAGGTCWGRAAADPLACREALAPALGALGLAGPPGEAPRGWIGRALAEPCVHVGCQEDPSLAARPGAERGSSVGLGPPDVPAAPGDPGSPEGSPAGVPPVAGRTPSGVGAQPGAGAAPGGATPGGSDTLLAALGPGARTDALAPGARSPCAGVDVAALPSRTSLSAGEVACLQARSRGEAGAGDADSQTAALALYNTRGAGWEAAVEAALAHGNTNAPLLNLAGMRRPYNAREYRTVLERARRAYSGAGSGYQLSDADLVFVFEHACRAAHQVHRDGKPAADGAIWCERWADRVRRKGGDVAPIEKLLSELE